MPTALMTLTDRGGARTAYGESAGVGEGDGAGESAAGLVVAAASSSMPSAHGWRKWRGSI